MALETSLPQSRRALLAAAAGGLVGFVANAVGHPVPAEAAAGDPLKLGKGAVVNNAGTANTSMRTKSSGNALTVMQDGSGNGLKGLASAGGSVGVLGQNNGSASTGVGVKGIGGHNTGVYGTTDNFHRYGVRGVNTAAQGDGVRGDAGAGGSGVIGISPSGYGVYGGSTSGHGVHGNAPSGSAIFGGTQSGFGTFGVATVDGVGVYGEAPSAGWAALFYGRIMLTSYMEIQESGSTPTASANVARLFVRDNGDKTELCVIFGTGAVQVIATEP